MIIMTGLGSRLTLEGNRPELSLSQIVTLTPLPVGPLDVFSMIGFCPLEIAERYISFKMRFLTGNDDTEVQEFRTDLLEMIDNYILKTNTLLGHSASGVVLHSGTEANFHALRLAQQKTGKKKVLTTRLSHISLSQACTALGLEEIVLEVDPSHNFRVHPDELKTKLSLHGNELAAIVSTYGTTQLGIDEGLHHTTEIQEQIKKYNTWLHIDAAYGGFNKGFLTEKSFLTSQVRSVTVDPHKFVGVLGCGVLMLINQNDDTEDNLPKAPYFSGVQTGYGSTRSAYETAVAVATMRYLGVRKMKELAQRSYNNAIHIGKGLPLIAPVESGVVAIQLSNAEQVTKMLTDLKQREYLASPVHIHGQGYDVHGIRAVAGPKGELSDRNIAEFKRVLDEVYKISIK